MKQTKLYFVFHVCLSAASNVNAVWLIQVGFNDWRHLSPRIPDYEHSAEHRVNYLTWKDFQQRLKNGGYTEDGFQRTTTK
jgi:hypothetical protein